MSKFKKGQSGNPGGRPRGSYSELCRSFADEVGWGLLERIARGQERSMRHPRLRLEAIKLLIAYGVGKPRESVELSSADGEPLAPAAPAIDFSWATKEQLWALLEFSEKSAAEDAKPKEE